MDHLTRTRGLLIAGFLLLPYTAAQAECRALEYAEIKDTPTPALVKTYCQYLAFSRIDMDTAGKLSEAYAAAIHRTPSLARSIDTRKVDEYHASSSFCLQQAQKISTAFVSRNEPRNPDCAPKTQ